MRPPRLKQLASPALREAWEDFVLSRQAMRCTVATLHFYEYQALPFLVWVEQSAGVTSPAGIQAKHVRGFLAALDAEGKADNTLHDAARAIKTTLRFFHAEGYAPESVKIQMPRVAQKRLAVLDAEELERAIDACHTRRDKAIIYFLADTGLRRSELCNLNWRDVDFSNGLVRVRQGKGRKDRAVIIGPTTRRALLKYRRTLKNAGPDRPLFLTRTGQRLSGSAVGVMFFKLRKKTGIPISAHALRRTFVILSLRAGMDVLHLQAMLGHGSLRMVQHYTQMIDRDLLDSHRQHSPIENLRRLREGGDTDT